MNIPTVIIGTAALLFGCYTVYVRKASPDKLAKLKAMQETFGQKKGTAVHVIFYSILPILFGLGLIFAGMLGVSFF